jgi:Cof subfamily protein (haloacid dehalogenase superfamily)
MPIKLVVTDLDNTLLRRDKTVSEYTKSVFARLRERGILFAFATSRSARASERFREMIMPDVNITSGGSIAVMGGKTLFRAAIDIETAGAVIRDLKASKEILQITADSEEVYFSSKPLDRSWSGWIDYASNTVVTDFSTPLPVPDVFKITPRAASLDAVLQITSRYPAVDVQSFTSEDWYQIKSRNASKQHAVAEVCAQLGFPLSDTAAFGDDMNDAEMLRVCGTGVAAANAVSETRAAADFICGDCDDDGVAKWIETHILT